VDGGARKSIRAIDRRSWPEEVDRLRPGFHRFETFEEAQEWMRSQMSRRSALRPSTTSAGSAAPSKKPEPGTSGTPVIVADVETLIRTKRTVRPSDAADRAWLEALREDENR
jgi:hypothetical protein